jgi:hypothetical protein
MSNPFCLFPELKSPLVIFFLAPPPSKPCRRSASPSVASSRASHLRSRPPSAPQLLPEAHRTGHFLFPPPEMSAHEHAAAARPRRRPTAPPSPSPCLVEQQHHINLTKFSRHLSSTPRPSGHRNTATELPSSAAASVTAVPPLQFLPSPTPVTPESAVSP